MNNQVKLLRALANPDRIRIVQFLAKNPEAGTINLYKLTGLSQPALSQHMSKLESAGAVTRRKDKLHVHYALKNREMLIRVLALISTVN